MIQKLLLLGSLTLVVFSLLSIEVNAQQDPQYTQYMYNTMSVNPAYTGQREVLSITGLYRTQWVGIEGAPKTLTFAAHSPLRNKNLGLGLSLVADKLGPSTETLFDVNFSYTIPVSQSGETELSFGLKGGVHFLDTDWSKGVFQNPDVAFNENVSIKSPIIGAGFYLHSDNWYLGLAVPNFIKTQHYDDFIESTAEERLHLFLIAGYVFDLSERTKLKPAALLKAVSGAPVIADLSINALFEDKITLGLAYRWDDSVSGLFGLQLNDGLYVGYSYDLTTTGLNNYNSGTHEVMLRFELQQLGKILSPRFF